ncbi:MULTISPECIES: hypothetical protein [unclassified Mesorhizobium]|uniref:hypothetical protein n=1 Tax=unclassified Mesorhizobium TaxID=325217 RepID=UPI0015E2A5F8|nr:MULTISPECIES: hypothetical protein [unclassified Mesorhizobium]
MRKARSNDCTEAASEGPLKARGRPRWRFSAVSIYAIMPDFPEWTMKKFFTPSALPFFGKQKEKGNQLATAASWK